MKALKPFTTSLMILLVSFILSTLLIFMISHSADPITLHPNYKEIIYLIGGITGVSVVMGYLMYHY
jgi:hypothetical protein